MVVHVMVHFADVAWVLCGCCVGVLWGVVWVLCGCYGMKCGTACVLLCSVVLWGLHAVRRWCLNACVGQL